MRIIGKDITLRDLHYRLSKWIQRLGKPSWKKHGEYRTLILNGVRYHTDTYSKAIWIGDFYFGLDYGGFEPPIKDPQIYKRHIGLLYQHWLKNKLIGEIERTEK